MKELPIEECVVQACATCSEWPEAAVTIVFIICIAYAVIHIT